MLAPRSASPPPLVPPLLQFCKDVEPGNARTKECLEEHREELSPGCKEEIDAMIERRVRDFRLDSKLRASCENEIFNMCAYFGVGTSGEGGRRGEGGDEVASWQAAPPAGFLSRPCPQLIGCSPLPSLHLPPSLPPQCPTLQDLDDIDTYDSSVINCPPPPHTYPHFRTWTTSTRTTRPSSTASRTTPRRSGTTTARIKSRSTSLSLPRTSALTCRSPRLALRIGRSFAPPCRR